jgi:hypothetical protein
MSLQPDTSNTGDERLEVYRTTQDLNISRDEPVLSIPAGATWVPANPILQRTQNRSFLWQQKKTSVP